MGESHRSCSACGTANGADAKFCGACGRPFATPVISAAPTFDDSTQVDAVPAAAPVKKVPAKTMFGMPAAALPATATSPAASTPAAAANSAVAPIAAAVTAAAASAPKRARTMLGMAAVPSPEATAAAAAPAAKVEVKVPAIASHRTMLGMAAVPLPSTAGSAVPAAGPAAPAAITNRTMLGMPASALPGAVSTAPSSRPPRRRAAVAEGAPISEPLEVAGIPKRGGALLLVALALLALGVLAVGAAVYVFTRPPEVRASVVETPAGERLRVEVPSAEPGLRVRVAGQEAALVSGAADLPLASNALHLGENSLAVGLVAADGSVEEVDVVLVLSYRVRPDLTGLATAEPHISLIIDVAAGARIEVEGEPLPADAHGHAQRDFPVEGDASAARLERVYRYRVIPTDGPAADGEVHVALPYTQLQVDRPGTQLVTDRADVELAGLVAEGASLSLDGAAVEVREGRFVRTLPLVELGEHRFVLVARQPEHAPRRVTIVVRRVADLSAEARGYEVDRNLTYTRIAQNPDIYRGQHVAFEGRIYNVRVEAGRSDVQILVRHCPRGQRCPLWVSYPAATDAVREDWIRVLGELAGEQQFRAESGEIMRVPKIEAVYLLPARP